MKISIGIADDHMLFLKSLSTLIKGMSTFQVMLEALNGEDLLQQLERSDNHPNIILLDVGMPILNGIKTASIVAKQYPSIRTVALSMTVDDTTILSMLRAGCCAYLFKDTHPDELEKALVEVHTKGYYNADPTNLIHRRRNAKAEEEKMLDISAREKEFLTLACSDLTYKEIATRMYVSDRTVDGYRDSLFQKFNVKSRTGMALEAIRRDLVTV